MGRLGLSLQVRELHRWLAACSCLTEKQRQAAQFEGVGHARASKVVAAQQALQRLRRPGKESQITWHCYS